MRRSSTLIDLQALGKLPSQNLDITMQAVAGDTLGEPLVNLNDERLVSLGVSASEGNLPQARSVFGVDTLWDREMAKLKEMEAREQAEAESQGQQGGTRHRNRQKKGKLKAHDNVPPSFGPSSSPGISESHTAPAAVAHSSPANRVLGRPPVAYDHEDDSEGDDNIPLGQIRQMTEKAAHDWVAEFSDDEDLGPKRTIGVGPRYPHKSKALASRPPQTFDKDEDSDEDLPLAAIVRPASQRATQLLAPGLGDDDDDDTPLAEAAQLAAKRATQLSAPRVDDDDDEDKPLGVVLAEGRLSLPSLSFDKFHTDRESAQDGNNVDDDDEDDDEEPLGLRASRIPRASQMSLGLTGGDEDDDKRLAFHPEHQRRTQYQMFVQMQQQQQQQQQQMMMQAQMHQSMYFGAPPMMASGFFAPSILPPAMMGMSLPVPMPPSPPPLHDPAKFGRVDRWRHDVAVEGQD